MSDSYRKILEHADEHFGAVARTQPGNLMCRLGCTMCCHGLFEIGAADVSVIAEGLDSLSVVDRDALVSRAEAIIEETSHPDLRDCSAEEKDQFFSRSENIPCPALGPNGACSIYEWRPIVCRTFGLPLREGDRYIGDVCELNFNDASQEQRETAAWDLLWEDVLGPEDEFTIPEAIVLAARLRKAE